MSQIIAEQRWRKGLDNALCFPQSPADATDDSLAKGPSGDCRMFKTSRSLLQKRARSELSAPVRLKATYIHIWNKTKGEENYKYFNLFPVIPCFTLIKPNILWEHGSLPLFFILSELYCLTTFCEAFPNSLCDCGSLLASCHLSFYIALFSQITFFSFCPTTCSQTIYFPLLFPSYLLQRFLFPSLLLLSPQGEKLESFLQCISLFFSWVLIKWNLLKTSVAVQVPSGEFY